MNIEIHERGEIRIAELTADHLLVTTAESGLQLLVDCYYQNFDGIILHEEHISDDFFDLKTGLAGEILQKFSNFRVRLVIVGSFDKYPGKSIRDFIIESNQGRLINFLSSITEAKERLFT
ncbi:DUF4180 domain-containing protein [Pedobacter sp. Du54]|uniref:DUF4180 domain-containing protein n=1 Tax=Pedobacter anseongensis TaxID=3133439 RepID=UPI0030AB4BA6